MSGENIVMKINKECKKRKISIYHLSKISNTRQSTLNSLLHNPNPNPKIDTIANIAKGLQMSIKDFFSDDLFDNLD